MNRERGSKLVGGGRSNRVRIGDGKESKSKTICTQGMTPVTCHGVQSTFNIKTPHDVSFFFGPSFLSFCFRITSLCRGSKVFFFRFVLLVAYRVSRLFFFFAPQLHINPNAEIVRIPLYSFQII